MLHLTESQYPLRNESILVGAASNHVETSDVLKISRNDDSPIYGTLNVFSYHVSIICIRMYDLSRDVCACMLTVCK